jgi:hypothetical protein
MELEGFSPSKENRQFDVLFKISFNIVFLFVLQSPEGYALSFY